MITCTCGAPLTGDGDPLAMYKHWATKHNFWGPLMSVAPETAKELATIAAREADARVDASVAAGYATEDLGADGRPVPGATNWRATPPGSLSAARDRLTVYRDGQAVATIDRPRFVSAT